MSSSQLVPLDLFLLGLIEDPISYALEVSMVSLSSTFDNLAEGDQGLVDGEPVTTSLQSLLNVGKNIWSGNAIDNEGQIVNSNTAPH